MSSPSSNEKKGWQFVLHGGCSRNYPDATRQQEIAQNLGRIGRDISSALSKGMTAKDAVILATCALEDCHLFNAGHGAVFNKDGFHQLEAGVVDGQTRAYGAVGCVETTKNPIRLAKALLDREEHAMLVGPGADSMAQDLGLEKVSNSYFSTEYRKTHWKEQKSKGTEVKHEEFMDTLTGTVGAVVLDSFGHLAAAGSTGGSVGKANGRIGDTCIIGAGLYADDSLSIVCSGMGDEILRKTIAANVARRYASGLPLSEAVSIVLQGIADTSCAIAAISADGQSTVQSTVPMFPTISMSSNTFEEFSLGPATLLAPRSLILDANQHVSISATRYPTTLGHTVAILQQGKDLFSTDCSAFVDLTRSFRRTASALKAYYKVERCALITEGFRSVSLLPLHGLQESWHSFTSDLKEFNTSFPGYVSSKDGPPASSDQLDGIKTIIGKVSKISERYNYRFDGPDSDQNLFARIVRGEIPQWRVWEDDGHVAFLTPFPNTPGFTVLVPRKHLSSDIFSLNEDDYTALMIAAHKVANLLKTAWGLPACGMIFEGFEIDYAHVKLIPIHLAKSNPGTSTSLDIGHSRQTGSFHDTYQGFVTSLEGPRVRDSESLARQSDQIRRLITHNALRPPKSWQQPLQHMTSVLEHEWYKQLFLCQNIFFRTSVQFFDHQLRYRYGFAPVTTDSISSPMGLGSDSEPVAVDISGQRTYLADSMQFALEYYLRIQEDVPGVYYISNSFRGEDSDAMHLSQFYHVECELRGSYDDGITVAERFIANMVAAFLNDPNNVVERVAGSVDHLKAFVERFRANGNKLPQITLDDAVALPVIDAECWRYVIPSDTSKGKALTRKGELKLIEYFGGAVWLTEMDHLSVPFYQAFRNNNRSKAQCADLLLGPGEVLGLGERHTSAQDLRTALEKHEVPSRQYSWYIDMKDQKPRLTTGWGMGIERFFAWLLAQDDIRDLTLTPRMKGSSIAP